MMDSFSRAARNITKGKAEAENWLAFFSEYKSRTNALAGTKYSLNLISVMMEEHLWQEEELSGIVSDFRELLRYCLDNGFSGDETVERLAAFKNRMKGIMECLMAYYDRFMIYEYMNNLVRNRYEDYDPLPYTDEEFTDIIMKYIISDKDQAVIRYKTMDVLKRLPVRMTKNRFFDMVKDGYSVYNGSDLSSAESFDYMLRGAALLMRPEGMENNFPRLFESDEHFSGLDLEALDDESFYLEKVRLGEATYYLGAHISALQLLTECVNDLYAYVLTSDASASGDISRAVEKLTSLSLSIEAPEDGYEPGDEEVECLYGLEGIQEEESEILTAADGEMDGIINSKYAAGADDGIKAQMTLVSDLSLLMSESSFAELGAQNAAERTAEAVDIARLFADFRDELTAKLSSVSKLMSRALMSSCIGRLPMNFENTDELSEYIVTSLRACTNIAEKTALCDDITSLMRSDETDEL